MMDIYANRKEEILKLCKAKEDFHRERGKLPSEEKIKILVELQKMATDFPTASKKLPSKPFIDNGFESRDSLAIDNWQLTIDNSNFSNQFLALKNEWSIRHS